MKIVQNWTDRQMRTTNVTEFKIFIVALHGHVTYCLIRHFMAFYGRISSFLAVIDPNSLCLITYFFWIYIKRVRLKEYFVQTSKRKSGKMSHEKMKCDLLRRALRLNATKAIIENINLCPLAKYPLSHSSWTLNYSWFLHL